jgi:hypothetical protein
MVTHRIMRLGFLPAVLLATLSLAPAQTVTDATHSAIAETASDISLNSPDAPSSALPDAPQATSQQPQVPTVTPSGTVTGPVPEHKANASRYHISKWHGVLDPGDKVPQLTTKDKMVFWLHEEINPISILPAAIGAGYSHMIGGDPKYGNDAPAFGERFGAAMLRDASMRFFSDSLVPTITHEDPRYFRMASGGVKNRALYAAERVFVDRRNSGLRGIDYSDTLGRLGGALLTQAYYPSASINNGVIFRTWGYSMLGGVGDNLLLEFWPDIRDRVFRRHQSNP